jgi:hypothetical protein
VQAHTKCLPLRVNYGLVNLDLAELETRRSHGLQLCSTIYIIAG